MQGHREEGTSAREIADKNKRIYWLDLKTKKKVYKTILGFHVFITG